MRCEICNRSMTESFIDGAGDEHEYCHHCIDEIQDTLDSYENEDEWYLIDPYDIDVEEIIEEEDMENQEVSSDGGTQV